MTILRATTCALGGSEGRKAARCALRARLGRARVGVARKGDTEVLGVADDCGTDGRARAVAGQGTVKSVREIVLVRKVELVKLGRGTAALMRPLPHRGSSSRCDPPCPTRSRSPRPVIGKRAAEAIDFTIPGASEPLRKRSGATAWSHETRNVQLSRARAVQRPHLGRADGVQSERIPPLRVVRDEDHAGRRVLEQGDVGALLGRQRWREARDLHGAVSSVLKISSG